MTSPSSQGPVPGLAEAGRPGDPGRHFGEFRRKVQQAELLSSSMHRLLEQLKFSGRLTVVVQNGRVLKSGYEESYFRHRT